MIYKEKWLEAIDYLIAYYKGKKEYKFCPLCDIVVEIHKLKNSHPFLCEYCLWYIFEHQLCDRYAFGKFPRLIKKFGCAAELRRCRPSSWVKDSLKRLNRWKKLLKNIESEDIYNE